MPAQWLCCQGLMGANWAEPEVLGLTLPSPQSLPHLGQIIYQAVLVSKLWRSLSTHFSYPSISRSSIVDYEIISLSWFTVVLSMDILDCVVTLFLP